MFQRTTCACKQCVACCERQPGPLAPGDFEKIAAHLGETREQAKVHFWASPGAMLQNERGVQFRIGSITPRMAKGKCVFLDDHDRCTIHAVAPFGCAYFDTHMSADVAMPRSVWLIRETLDPTYQELRSELPFATSYKPTGY